MICNFCNKEFENKKIRNKNNKHNFCSRSCYSKFRSKFYVEENSGNWKGGKIKRICKTCGNEYYVYKYRNQTSGYCSISCSAKSNVPDRFRNAKNIIDRSANDLRNTEEYTKWRDSVYRRDYWTCYFCGYKGNKIVAHHINGFLECPERRFDTTNGMTLCTKCHACIHACREDTIFFLESLVKSVETERGASQDDRVKLQSVLHSNMQRQAEMACPSI